MPGWLTDGSQMLRAQAAGSGLGKTSGEGAQHRASVRMGLGGQGGVSVVTLQFSEMCCWDRKAGHPGPGAAGLPWTQRAVCPFQDRSFVPAPGRCDF